MGYYINPPDMTKEAFLVKHGTKRTVEEVRSFNWSQTDTLPVCLVANPMFTAAGIAYDPREANTFLDGMGGRRFQWYEVPTELLKPYYNRSAK